MKPREKLREICDLLAESGMEYPGMQSAVEGNDEELWRHLTPNELRGGAGSVADQAALEFKDTRSRLKKLMVEPGQMQMKIGRTNVRTEMWTEAFRQWHEKQ